MVEKTWQEILRDGVDANGYLSSSCIFKDSIPLDEFVKELAKIAKERKAQKDAKQNHNL